MGAKLNLDRESIAEFCRLRRIARLGLFGSAIRDDFQAESDVDVFVEFEPGSAPGLEFFTMQEELSRLFGRPVDLNTPGFLSPEIRDRVIAEAEILYEREHEPA